MGYAVDAVQHTIASNDVIVSLWLVSRGTEYIFELSNNHGSFSWRGGDATAAAKDCLLRATIVIGAWHGLSHFPSRLPPPIQLAQGMHLAPHAHTVGGQGVIVYESGRTHVRIYSRHRELRKMHPNTGRATPTPRLCGTGDICLDHGAGVAHAGLVWMQWMWMRRNEFVIGKQGLEWRRQ